MRYSGVISQTSLNYATAARVPRDFEALACHVVHELTFLTSSDVLQSRVSELRRAYAVL